MGNQKKDSNNVTSRIGETFNAELEAIKKQRIDSGLDKKKKSTRKLTELIIKHNSWPAIKRDLLKINLEKKNHE